MPVAITATEARSHFGEVIRRVHEGGETLIVERSGLPVVVILPVPEYQTVQTWKQARFAQAVRAAAREAEEQGLTEKQVERQVRQVREEVYRNGWTHEELEAVRGRTWNEV